MHVENVSNYMYSKIKYSEHTNMIFFTLNGVSFISLNVRVSMQYINWMFILVITIQNYFPDSLICKFDYYYSLI